MLECNINVVRSKRQDVSHKAVSRKWAKIAVEQSMTQAITKAAIEATKAAVMAARAANKMVNNSKNNIHKA